MARVNLKGESVFTLLNPRRGLGTAVAWLIIALACLFTVSAVVWVGGIARRNVLEQHIRRLSLETDQLSTDFSQALAARFDAVRSASTLSQPGGRAPVDVVAIFSELTASYPHLNWLAAADATGTTIAGYGARDPLPQQWAKSGLTAPWLGIIDAETHVPPLFGLEYADVGDVAIPVRDSADHPIGAISAHLQWRRAAHHPERLTDEPDPRTITEVSILDREGKVMLGPRSLIGQFWPGVQDDDGTSRLSRNIPTEGPDTPKFERMPDGRRVLVSRSELSATGELAATGWQVILSEPRERVFQRANAVESRILWVSLCLGALTSAVGVLGARHLTRRLVRLAQSVSSVSQELTSIEVPSGSDEVARLGKAFAKLLDELAQERGDLERRVVARTREVERLADESRYAAIVRERLRLARDLHDTLAHSMMALLSQVRLLRRLQDKDPKALALELASAEEMAHEGLLEARNAIAQMRVTAVRESGLGPALAQIFERFTNLSGISGDFECDDAASRFGDERAESMLRAAQEALRNIERHSKATRASMQLKTSEAGELVLKISDNGIGFDVKSVPPGHFGLIGLQEQASLIGARVQIESRPEHGTQVLVCLPLSPMEPR